MISLIENKTNTIQKPKMENKFKFEVGLGPLVTHFNSKRNAQDLQRALVDSKRAEMVQERQRRMLLQSGDDSECKVDIQPAAAESSVRREDMLTLVQQLSEAASEMTLKWDTGTTNRVICCAEQLLRTIETYSSNQAAVDAMGFFLQSFEGFNVALKFVLIAGNSITRVPHSTTVRLQNIGAAMVHSIFNAIHRFSQLPRVTITEGLRKTIRTGLESMIPSEASIFRAVVSRLSSEEHGCSKDMAAASFFAIITKRINTCKTLADMKPWLESLRFIASHVDPSLCRESVLDGGTCKILLKLLRTLSDDSSYTVAFVSELLLLHEIIVEVHPNEAEAIISAMLVFCRQNRATVQHADVTRDLLSFAHTFISMIGKSSPTVDADVNDLLSVLLLETRDFSTLERIFFVASEAMRLTPIRLAESFIVKLLVAWATMTREGNGDAAQRINAITRFLAQMLPEVRLCGTAERSNAAFTCKLVETWLANNDKEKILSDEDRSLTCKVLELVHAAIEDQDCAMTMNE